MNKLLIVLAFLVSSGSISAQKSPLALNVYGSYIFQDRVAFDNFTGYVKEGFQYGAGLEYFATPNNSVELKYLRQDTHFPLHGPTGEQQNTGKDKGSVNYILIGGNTYFGTSPTKPMPYGGIGLGIGIVDAEESGSATKFAWDANLGVKFRTSGRISLRLQASLQSIISSVGSDLYIAAGGAAIAVPDYATILQFGLGGGLSFRF